MSVQWTANKEYIFEEAGTFAILNGGDRTYNKTNKGKAIVAVIRDASNYTQPCLLSTNREAVVSWCSYNPSYVQIIAEVIISGITWYFEYTPYGYNHYVSNSGFAPVISVNNYTNIENVVQTILTVANVKIKVPSDKIKNLVKNKILNHKLIQHIALHESEE